MRFIYAVSIIVILGLADMRASALQHAEPAMIGPIASVTVERYSVNERDWVWQSGIRRTVTLVPLGGPLPPGMSAMQVEGILTESVRTQYTPSSALMLEERRNGHGEITSRTEYIHDEYGRCVEIRESRGDRESVVRTIREHDDEGRLIAWLKEDASGVKLEERILQYDEQGRLAKETRVAGDGEIKEILRYRHDEDQGRVIIEYYNRDDEYTMSRERVFDEEGRMIWEQFGDRDGEPSGYLRRRYDNRGRLLETRFVRQTEVEYRSVYRYNDHDHPVEIERSNQRGIIEWRVYAYEFDGQGNWIRRAAYERSMRRDRSEIEPESLEVRVIEYE